MTDFLLVARDKGLYRSITDNGAGGLSSSVGEMARIPAAAESTWRKRPSSTQGSTRGRSCSPRPRNA